MYTIKIIPRTLHFKQPAGTSRGVYRTRKVWYLVLQDPADGRCGIGECAPLPALSCDDIPDYEDVLACHCQRSAEQGCIDYDALRPYPSMLFGLETAFLHLQAGSLRFWDTPFSRGEEGIPIMRNVPLARSLYEQGTENAYIPQDLIGPVAEVLRWVQSLRQG